MSSDTKIKSFDDVFIDAILEKKNQMKFAIDSSKVDHAYPEDFEDKLKVYVNLVEEYGSIFNKRSRKLIPFKDKRIKNLITLLADDFFWKEVYSSCIEFYDHYYQNSDLPKVNFNTNYLYGKSIISRLIYFLMGKNPYGKDLFKKNNVRFFAEEVEYSSRAEMLTIVTNRLNLEIQSFSHYCQGVIPILKNQSETHYFGLEAKQCVKAFEFLLSSFAEGAKLIEILNRLWLHDTQNYSYRDEDLLLLWGGTKRAYFNDVENRPKRKSKLEFGYTYDDALKWLRLKNALGKDGFNFEFRENDINYPKDLDELSTLFVTANKQRVPVDKKVNKEQILDKEINIFQSIEAIKEKYSPNELSNSEKQEFKKKLLDLLNEIS